MLRKFAILLLGTGASKGLGVVREVAFAAWFGTTEVAAAFKVAQTAFLLPSHALVGDTLSGGALPIYQGARAGGDRRGAVYAAVILVQATLVGALIGLGLWAFAGTVVGALVPGATESVRASAAGMLRVMAVAAPLYVVGNSLAYLQAAHGRFAGISSRTSLVNVGMIAAAATAAATGVTGWLAAGLVGVHLAFLGWTLAEYAATVGLPVVRRGEWATAAEAFAAVWRNTRLLLGVPLIAQANVMFERVVASWLGTAVIPSVDYARLLSDTVMTVSAVPLGVIALTANSVGTRDRQSEQAARVGGVLLAVAVPLSTVLWVAAEPVVRLLFARGAFGADSVAVTAAVLRGTSAALAATVTGYYLLKVLSAGRRNGWVLGLTIAAVACNAGFNAATWGRLGPAALGYGNSVYGLVQFAGAAVALGVAAKLGRVVIGSLAAAVAAAGAASAMPPTGVAAVDIAVAAGAVGAAWAALYAASPAFRAAVAPALSRLARFRRRADQLGRSATAGEVVTPAERLAAGGTA
ncbi:MAG TPA: lipid II flippase MurJ [Humisphaera sp.]